jgi:hypothetical protein
VAPSFRKPRKLGQPQFWRYRQKSRLGQPPLTQENHFNLVDNPTDRIGQAMKAWNDRLTVQGRPLVEQYKQGWLTLVCDLAISKSRQGPFSDPLSSDDPRADDVLLASLIFQANVSHNVHAHHREQEPVFVDNVHIVQGPEGIIPSLVRLYGLHNEVTDLFGGLLYQSAVDGNFKCVSGFSEWKPSVIVVTTEPPKDNFVNSTIESGLEIMKRVSDDEGKVAANKLRYFDFKEILSCLRITVDAEYVNAACGEATDRTVEVVNVLLGPLNL